jgi:hypothetical protein
LNEALNPAMHHVTRIGTGGPKYFGHELRVMYAHIMSHRTQITLTDEQYRRFREESARSGLPLAELVRRAVDECYTPATHNEFLEALDNAFGIWADREEYVDRLRPGLARRLSKIS